MAPPGFGVEDVPDVRLSLRWKVGLFVMAVALASGALPSAYAVLDARRAARERVDAQLEQLAGLVAGGGLFADGRGDVDGRALRAFVRNAPSLRLPIAYVLVEDASGRIDPRRSALSPELLAEILPEATEADLEADRERWLAALPGAALAAGHRGLSVRIQGTTGQPLGALRIGMSTVEADREARDALVSGFAMVAALLIGATVLSLAAAGRLARPLARLVEAMGRVAAGDLDQTLPVRGRDEIGRLTRAFNTMTEGLRQRARLRRTLVRYVSDDVAERILEEADDLDLAGEIRPVSVLFLDIRGFTALSERLSPAQVVELLNTYFEILVEAIVEEEGVINKFIGDAILAVWGAPRPTSEHPWRAVRAAWKIRERVAAFNRERERAGREVVEVRIGINTGEAIAGNIGSARRLEYTVIGDDVNLAQRLESIAPPGGVLMSEATRQAVGDRVSARRSEPVRLKGKSQPVSCYELDGIAEDAMADRRVAEGRDAR